MWLSQVWLGRLGANKQIFVPWRLGFLRDPGSSSCQGWVSLRWIPHSSAGGTHANRSLFLFSLDTAVSVGEQLSFVLRLTASNCLKSVLCPCPRMYFISCSVPKVGLKNNRGAGEIGPHSLIAALFCTLCPCTDSLVESLRFQDPAFFLPSNTKFDL